MFWQMPPVASYFIGRDCIPMMRAAMAGMDDEDEEEEYYEDDEE